MPPVSRNPPDRRAPASPPVPRSPRADGGAPGEIRLIGGRWKRTRLPVLAEPGLRPTPDRVRETLFNWLGQELSGWRVLDAFAGTGALGFEAASRGAVEVVLLEQAPRAAAQLQQAAARLGATMVAVHRTDALGWMAGASAGHFDLVLLDPPFGADLFERALKAATRLLGEGGWLYLEADRAFDESTLAAHGLRLHRHGRAGMVHYHLLQMHPAGEPACPDDTMSPPRSSS